MQKKISCNRILSGEYIYKMKKTLALLMLIMIVFSMASKDSMAAKKAKGGGSSISQEDIIGKVFIRVWPFSRFGFV